MKKIFIKIFFIVIIVFVSLIIISKWQTKSFNGSVDGWYHEDGVFYVVTGDNEYNEVTEATWVINNILGMAIMIFYFLFGICFIIFMVTYVLPFIWKESKRALGGYKE
jgi:hypothetical protein